jgi:hypothetical protein
MGGSPGEEARIDLLTEQHAAAELGSLPDDNIDRICVSKIRRIALMARRQTLICEKSSMAGSRPKSCASNINFISHAVAVMRYRSRYSYMLSIFVNSNATSIRYRKHDS